MFSSFFRLEMQDNMRMVHLLELKQLEFEKTLLAIHYSRMVKPADLIREMKVTYFRSTTYVMYIAWELSSNFPK
jgi:hypothetical protein